jgi:hypothetical protein
MEISLKLLTELHRFQWPHERLLSRRLAPLRNGRPQY